MGGKGPKSGLLSVKRKARGDAEETPAKEKKDRKDLTDYLGQEVFLV